MCVWGGGAIDMPISTEGSGTPTMRPKERRKKEMFYLTTHYHEIEDRSRVSGQIGNVCPC